MPQVTIKSRLKQGANALLSFVRDTVGIDGRYYRWGRKDNFPNTILDSANDSGTAQECIDKLFTFIHGHGLPPALGEEIAYTLDGVGHSWAEVWEDTAIQLARFPAVTWQIKYDVTGEIAAVIPLPVQHIRKRHDGQFLYKEGLGDPSGYHYNRRVSSYIIPAFGTHKTASEKRQLIAKQKAKYGEQMGEIMYVYTKGMGLLYEHYPIPKWSAGLHDINADAGLSLHEESQVANSFKGAVIIETPEIDKVNKDDTGKTPYDYFKEEMKRFTQPDGSPILHIETLTREFGASVTPLNIQHQMDATQNATERIAKKVCRHFSVPPLLLGIETAGKLGNQQELVNFIKLFSLTIDRRVGLFYRAMTALYPEMNKGLYQVRSLALYDYVPDKVIERMTGDQLEKVFSLPEGSVAPGKAEPIAPDQQAAVNEHIKTLTGRQQQHLDRIVRKYRKGELTIEQAVLQLTSGFGLTEEQAELYLKSENPSDANPD